VADQDNQAELDKIMGRPSNFKPDPPPPAPTAHDIDAPASLADHLRGIMGTKGGIPAGETRGPGGKTIMQAVDEAVAGAPKTPEE